MSFFSAMARDVRARLNAGVAERRLVTLVEALSANANAASEELERVRALRVEAGTLSDRTTVRLAEAYRRLTAHESGLCPAEVGDIQVGRLDALDHAFAPSEEVRRRARLDFFCDLFRRYFAERAVFAAPHFKMLRTNLERLEVDLAELRKRAPEVSRRLEELLEISKHQLDVESWKERQFERARAFHADGQTPAEARLFLDPGEVCYYGTEAREYTKSVTTFGLLFITDRRIFYKSERMVTIKLMAVLDVKVDPETWDLCIYKSERQRPYLFKLNEPYLVSELILLAQDRARA